LGLGWLGIGLARRKKEEILESDDTSGSLSEKLAPRRVSFVGSDLHRWDLLPKVESRTVTPKG